MAAIQRNRDLVGKAGLLGPLSRLGCGPEPRCSNLWGAGRPREDPTFRGFGPCLSRPETSQHQSQTRSGTARGTHVL